MFTILSGIFGGLLRLAPEVLKFLNGRADRKHELDMQEVAYKFQQLKGSQKMDEIAAQGQADWNTGALAALKSAIEGQDAPSGVKWIDGLSKLIRPLIAFEWVVLLYPGVIIATFIIAVQSGTPVLMAMNQAFGPEEKALIAFIVDFYFIGRVLDRGIKGK